MSIVTIPKKLANQGDLVVISRQEYEALIGASLRKFKEFIPTAAQKRALKNARHDYQGGKFMTFDELKRRLAHKG